jgi:B9 domain-containing protein 2
MPEVHIIGEIEGASGFSTPNLYCKWKIVSDDEQNWTAIEGATEGQTQVDFPSVIHFEE